MEDHDASGSAVTVVIRVRPYQGRELRDSNTRCVVEMTEKTCVLYDPAFLHEPDPKRRKHKNFTFDRCYWSFGRHETECKSAEDEAILKTRYCLPSGSSSLPHAEDQEKVYNEIGSSLLKNAYSGFNCCLFAYGQTGSGKSFSMMGGSGDNRGIIPRLSQALFEKAASNTESNVTFRVQITYIEIYAEKIRDLLGKAGTPFTKKEDAAISTTSPPPKKLIISPHPIMEPDSLKVREHPVKGTYVEGVNCMAVSNWKSLEAFMILGNQSRATAATNMNEHSSRSHAVFTITFTQETKDDETNMSSTMTSKIQLVDLAGSERQESSGATGQRLKEASAINTSLTTLGMVINALAKIGSGSSDEQKEKEKEKEAKEGNPPPASSSSSSSALSWSGVDYNSADSRPSTAGGGGGAKKKSSGASKVAVSSPGTVKAGDFVPYRNSVLTHLLKDSLGGNSKTVMISAISPAACNFDETMTTLQYATRAKSIKNKAVVNEDENASTIRKLKKEISDLRAKLALVDPKEVDASEGQMSKLKQELASQQAAIVSMHAEWEEKVAEAKVRQEEMQKEYEARQKDVEDNAKAVMEMELREIELQMAHEKENFLRKLEQADVEKKDRIARLERDREEKIALMNEEIRREQAAANAAIAKEALLEKERHKMEAQMQQEMAFLQAKISEIESSKTAEANELRGAYAVEKEALAQALETLAEERSSAKERAEQAEADLEAQRLADKATYAALLKALEDQRDAAEAMLTKEKEALSGQLQFVTRQMEAEKERLQGEWARVFEEEKKRLLEIAETQRREKEALEAKVLEKDVELTELHAHLRHRSMTYHENQTAMSQLIRDMKELEANKSEATREQMDQLQARLREQEALRADAESALKETMEALSRHRSSSISSKDRLQQMQRMLQQKEEVSRKELDDLQQTLTYELDNVRQKNLTLAQLVETVRQQKEEKEQELLRQRQQSDEMMRKLQIRLALELAQERKEQEEARAILLEEIQALMRERSAVLEDQQKKAAALEEATRAAQQLRDENKDLKMGLGQTTESGNKENAELFERIRNLEEQSKRFFAKQREEDPSSFLSSSSSQPQNASLSQPPLSSASISAGSHGHRASLSQAELQQLLNKAGAKSQTEVILKLQRLMTAVHEETEKHKVIMASQFVALTEVQQAEAELAICLQERQREEEAFQLMLRTLKGVIADESKGIVQRNKAQAELSSLEAQDYLPLNRAKLQSEAKQKRLAKTRVALEKVEEELRQKATDLEEAVEKAETDLLNALDAMQ